VEALHEALAQPALNRHRLFIRCETVDQELPWTKIAELTARTDFPRLI